MKLRIFHKDDGKILDKATDILWAVVIKHYDSLQSQTEKAAYMAETFGRYGTDVMRIIERARSLP